MSRKATLNRAELKGIAERIRTVATESFDSINEFAAATGIARNTISTWIRSPGPKPPGAAHLVTIARVARVNLNWLLVGIGEPHVLTAIEPYGTDPNVSAKERPPPESPEEHVRRLLKTLVRLRRLDLGHSQFEAAWDLMLANLDYSMSTPNRVLDLAIDGVLSEFDAAVRGQTLYANMAHLANEVDAFIDSVQAENPDAARRFRKAMRQRMVKTNLYKALRVLR